MIKEYNDICFDEDGTKVLNLKLLIKEVLKKEIQIDVSDIVILDCIFDDNNIYYSKIWDTDNDNDIIIRYNHITKSYSFKTLNSDGFETKNDKVVVKISKILSLFIETHINIWDRQGLSSSYFCDDIRNEEWDYTESILDRNGVKLTDLQHRFLYEKSLKIAKEVY